MRENKDAPMYTLKLKPRMPEQARKRIEIKTQNLNWHWAEKCQPRSGVVKLFPDGSSLSKEPLIVLQSLFVLPHAIKSYPNIIYKH